MSRREALVSSTRKSLAWLCYNEKNSVWGRMMATRLGDADALRGPGATKARDALAVHLLLRTRGSQINWIQVGIGIAALVAIQPVGFYTIYRIFKAGGIPSGFAQIPGFFVSNHLVHLVNWLVLLNLVALIGLWPLIVRLFVYVVRTFFRIPIGRRMEWKWNETARALIADFEDGYYFLSKEADGRIRIAVQGRAAQLIAEYVQQPIETGPLTDLYATCLQRLNIDPNAA